MEVTKRAMEDVGLRWNKKKCFVAHVKHGFYKWHSYRERSCKHLERRRELQVFRSPREREAGGQAFTTGDLLSIPSKTAFVLVQFLSDYHKVLASSQYAFRTLLFAIWTQTWPLTELQQLDRETNMVIKETGGSHPSASTELLYLPRISRRTGLMSIESEYKLIKLKDLSCSWTITKQSP